jgi:ketosteroid isomerase-like protein
MKHVVIGVLFPALLTAACDSATTSDPAADRQAVAAASAQFQAAENAGSLDQMRVHFADDLVIMGPNMPPVTGADSVAALMRVFHDAFAVQVEYNGQEIVVFGDWAFDRGTYRYTLTPKAGGAPIRATGKYLWLYQRQEDGSWKQAESSGIAAIRCQEAASNKRLQPTKARRSHKKRRSRK